MLNSNNKSLAVVFLIGLLFFASTVRSDVIVDQSFLPRFLGLTLILLLTYFFLFKGKLLYELNLWTFSLFAFYIWNLTSFIWATSVSEAIAQSQLVFLGIAVFGIVSTFNKSNVDFEKLFVRVHVLVLLFSYCLASFKMLTLQFYDPYKISSISLNNNLYSGYLLLSFPIVLRAYSINKGDWKYLSMLTGILCLFFLIILQTRAAYIGMAFALIIITIIILIKYRYIFSKQNIFAGFISIAILAIAISLFYHSLDATRRNAFESKVAVWNYFVPSNNDQKTDNIQIKDIPKKGIAEMAAVSTPVEYFENVNSRLIFWKKSFGLIKNHPIIGVGAGNWRLVVASINEPPNPLHTINNYTYSQPHNEWVGFLSELGIIGFVLAICIFILPIFQMLLKLTFGKPKSGMYLLFYSGFLAGFYVYASFDFPFKRIEHLILVFSILAFLFNKLPLDEIITLPTFKIRKYTLLFQRVFISLLLFTVIVAGARIKGEYYTLKFFTDERKNDNAVVKYAQKATNIFYRITPNTLPVAWFEGVAHFRLGQYQKAVQSFELSIKSTPYEVRVLNDYGTGLFALSKNSLAIDALKKSISIDPDFDEAKFNLSAIYYSMQKPDSALFYANKCRESQKRKDYINEIKISGLH